jgi:hypothetical protein
MSECKPTDGLLITSSFGGGWVVPKTDAGRESLSSFFGGPASELMPLEGDEGWIIEPHELEFLKEHADDTGITVRLQR